MAIIDCSVYVAAISPQEEFHIRSLAWLQQAAAAKTPLSAPAILLVEVAAALGRGQGDDNLVRRAVSILRNSTMIRLQPVSLVLAESAAKIAGEQRIRGCDAVYVALASQLNQPLVTLDRQQARRGGAVVKTIDLSEPS